MQAAKENISSHRLIWEFQENILKGIRLNWNWKDEGTIIQVKKSENEFLGRETVKAQMPVTVWYDQRLCI